MNKREQRREAIADLLMKEQIVSQEGLLQRLLNIGYDITQATLSRDLKELKVIKAPGPDGKYAYVFPQTGTRTLDNDETFAVSGFVSLQFSGNMAVMKTKPGFANGIASIIDRVSPNYILGTIAGDDTILLIIKEGISQLSATRELSKLIPGII